MEKIFAEKINQTRRNELALYSGYVNIKNICGAIYQNAGVLISSMIFLFVDKEKLELGKVFSTLALLGYIFNFSILYSNYAIEAVYSLKVFNKRIKEVIDSSFEKQKHYLSTSAVEATIIDDDYDPLASFRSKKAL